MLEVNIEKALKNGTLQEKIDNMKREIEQMQEEIKKCERTLEESKKPKLAVPFCPKREERFYGYYYNGAIFSDKFINTEGKDFYSKKVKLEGLYKTEEKAKLAYEKRCAEVELMMMCDFFEVSDRQYFAPLFVNHSKKWIVENCCNYIETPYRFASKESCQKAIDKLGNYKLRLIFNIPLDD